MKVLIIIPTYNEKDTIARIISEVGVYMPHAHVLVVDDNSPDGTASIVKDIQKQNPHVYLLSRKGKEGLSKAYIDAFRHGLNTYNPERIVTMDADMSHHPKYLVEMERVFDTGSSVVIGSRYISGGSTVGWNAWRRALSYFGNMYARTVIDLPISDVTAGFCMIDAALLQSINLDDIDSSGYAFLMELKNLLHKAGGKITEVPISFEDRIVGESKISNSIIAEGLLAPWKIRFK